MRNFGNVFPGWKKMRDVWEKGVAMSKKIKIVGIFSNFFRIPGIWCKLQVRSSSIRFRYTSRTLPKEMLMDKSSLWLWQSMSLKIKKTILLQSYGILGLLAIWCQDDQESFQIWFDSCFTSKCFHLRHSCRNKSVATGNVKLNIVVTKWWKHFVLYSDCEQFDIGILLIKAKSVKWEVGRPNKAFVYGKVWFPISRKINNNTRFECSWISRIWRNVEKPYSPDRTFF